METTKELKRTIIKYLPVIVIYVLLLSWCCYGVYIRQKKLYYQYNNMKGVITSYSKSLNGDYICYVRLSNGLSGEVNYGYNIVSVGDTYNNDVSYNSIFGISGLAYFVVPSEGRIMIEGCMLWVLLVLPMAALIIACFCILCTMWSIKSEEILDLKETQKENLLYFKRLNK